jgi:hypothetical protein
LVRFIPAWRAEQSGWLWPSVERGRPQRSLRDALLDWRVEQITEERRHRHIDPMTVFGKASTDKLREV